MRVSESRVHVGLGSSVRSSFVLCGDGVCVRVCIPRTIGVFDFRFVFVSIIIGAAVCLCGFRLGVNAMLNDVCTKQAKMIKFELFE